MNPNLGGANFGPTQFSLPTSTVEMSIRCSGLADCDFLSKSDPVAIIFGKFQDKWEELWRSEMLLNDLNPNWKSTFVHEYRFEETQPIKIEIYDWDTNDSGVTKKLKDQDLIGGIETNMANLVSAKNYSAVLRNKSNKGQFFTYIAT